MKIHNDFTLYYRETPSGKRIVYFYAYDENGNRTQGRSTGQINKTAARVLVNRLLKEGGCCRKKTMFPLSALMPRTGGIGRIAST